MKYRILLLIFLFSQFVFSQECVLKKGKQSRSYKKVRNLINKGKLNDARNYLKSISDYHSMFDALKAEIAWLNSEDIEAQKHADNALYRCDSLPNVYYLLGEIAYRRKDFVNAAIYLRKSLDLGVSDSYLFNAQKYYPKAQSISNIITNPIPFSPQILDSISTYHDEYLPMISADQKTFFYTKRYIKQGVDIFRSSYKEKFLFSSLKNEKFGSGKVMPDPFNLSSNEGGSSLTIDNSILYYTRCSEIGGGFKNCDLFYVVNKDGEWQDIIAFKEGINKKDSWESQPSVSADGKTIVFTSNRVGGYGGLDLYAITKSDNGNWGNPKNLGPLINTKNEEKSPFLHPDGETLFFASTQFPSLGGFDIFFSRRDTTGNWQKPVNIGYPINTVSDQVSLSVSTDGERAFFASNKLNGLGGWDIYSFDLYEEAKPQRVLFLQGNLTDKDGNPLDYAQLEIKNIHTKKNKSIDIKNGIYTAAVTLARDDDVLLSIKKKGYSFNSKYIASNDNNFFSPSNLDFSIDPLEEGGVYRLNNVYFASNLSEINSVSKEVLLLFSEYLVENKSFNVSIHGHTDNIGSRRDNLVLSKSRALAVYNFLTKQGVNSDRLSYDGFGEDKPLSSNLSKEGRAENRRTEFMILERE